MTQYKNLKTNLYSKYPNFEIINIAFLRRVLFSQWKPYNFFPENILIFLHKILNKRKEKSVEMFFI